MDRNQRIYGMSSWNQIITAYVLKSRTSNSLDFLKWAFIGSLFHLARWAYNVALWMDSSKRYDYVLQQSGSSPYCQKNVCRRFTLEQWYFLFSKGERVMKLQCNDISFWLFYTEPCVVQHIWTDTDVFRCYSAGIIFSSRKANRWKQQ